MARRAVSSDSNDSQKENNDLPSTASSSKSNYGRVARGKRAAMRDHVEAEEEEEEEEEEEDKQLVDEEEGDKDADGEVDGAGEEDEDEEDGGEQSPKGRKRARANTQGDARPTGGSSKAEKRGQTLPRDVDGFIPGSIVRIQLRNFLTYDWVEFRPGPYLNMIFGPNGTGKSSIACAICIGLNFPPTVLGRAPDLKSFVKNDRKDGHVEIELKGAQGEQNLVIRRNLHSNSKSAPFMLNGKSTSGTDINTKMGDLNVQVSNLCTFLPQDRVAEFARMSPQQLLKETQRAAGNAKLTEWHDTLIQCGKELRTVQDLVSADREQLKTMEERNANLERDVRRYEERRALEQRIKLLELIIPFKQYYEAREEYRTLKPIRREAIRTYKLLEKRHAPFVEMLDKLGAELKQREKAREDKKASARRKFKEMGVKLEENQKYEEQSEELKNKLDNLKKAEKERIGNMRRLEKAIEEVEKRLANPPEMEDLDEINRQMKQLNQENNRMRQKQQELQDTQRVNVETHSRVRREIDGINQQLHQLDSHAHQKLEALKQSDPDCALVVSWLRKNRDRFKMEIFEPAVLCVTVPNKAYVDAVEACFGGSQLRTFVAQCEEDYQQLNRLCVDTPEALGKRARINTWYKAKDESRLSAPPLPADQLQTLGFDGYALDFIDCPEGLKWFLCSDVRLHRTAISVRHPQAVDQNRAMDMAARAGGANYIVGRVMNTVTRSRYGKRLPQNATREIQPSRNLAHAMVDPQVKRNLQMQLAEAQTRFRAVQQEEEELSRQDKGIQEEGKAFKEDHDKLEARKRAVLDAQRKIQSLELKLNNDRQKLARMQNAPPADVERNKIKQNLLTLASKRVEAVKDYVSLMRAAISEQDKATRAALQHLQVSANKDALQSKSKEQMEEMEAAKKRFADLHVRWLAAKALSVEKLDLSKAKLSECTVEVKQKFQEMEESGEVTTKSAEEWDAELEQSREELNMNMATNANVVEQFNKRKAEIDALTATVEDREKRIVHIEGRLKLARDHWQPELEKLVGSIGQKFSSAFDRIGCAGEVRIREDEDYEKWAIDIMVKFRDHEKLQLLTGERQSGGERSLTTILYLMSLTEEARAPFSLVDEINQGMDQRAERAVHNSLVEVTCKPDSGQYFLITPKLLPDLHYHERMRILCVNNGEWLPEDRDKDMGSMNGLIDTYLRFRQSRGNASA